MINEETDDITVRPLNSIQRMREEYFGECDAIIERARNNRRRLSVDDLKQLRELAKAIKELDKGIMPRPAEDPMKRLLAAVERDRIGWEEKRRAEAENRPDP
jgi:hypothetical protein